MSDQKNLVSESLGGGGGGAGTPIIPARLSSNRKIGIKMVYLSALVTYLCQQIIHITCPTVVIYWESCCALE